MRKITSVLSLPHVESLEFNTKMFLFNSLLKLLSIPQLNGLINSQLVLLITGRLIQKFEDIFKTIDDGHLLLAELTQMKK